MPGLLVLAGGSEFEPPMARADRAWMAHLAPSPRVLVLPTANVNHPGVAAANGALHFQGLGARPEPLLVTDRAGAASEDIVGRIESADAVYKAGGEPTYLAEVLQGSLLWDVLRRRWEEGMGLGGSSAGAMVLCQAMYLRGEWHAGLGLLEGAVVLPHFNRWDERRRQTAEGEVRARGLVGIGIDESTSLYCHEGAWKVAGAASVTLIGSRYAVFSDGDVVEGLPLP